MIESQQELVRLIRILREDIAEIKNKPTNVNNKGEIPFEPFK